MTLASARDLSRIGLAAMFALVACTVRNPKYSVCTAKQSLRCDGANLIRCNDEGTAEVSQPCPLGCNADMLRCTDVDPSNGLAQFLDATSAQSDLNLGDSATVDTDTGDVSVGGTQITAATDAAIQSSGPAIRVLIARSLTAGDVIVTGKSALAIVSDGDITIQGTFAVSAADRDTPGAGAFSDGGCQGARAAVSPLNAYGGDGGGGFGSSGGAGGSAQNANGFRAGGFGGNATGNASLIPLRGGCGGGLHINDGGGAIQLVSRTQIVVSGAVAANGAAGRGGGSGGGILLEAPAVVVSGRVAANGGAGIGCLGNGENGRLDDKPAMGGSGCAVESASGSGAAGNVGATNGAPMNVASTDNVYGGAGGAGVGRIRVNVAADGLRTTGIFSPNPSQGTLATR